MNVLINDEKPHLVCITETWLNDEISNAMISFDNYYIDKDLRIDRADTSQGRGGGLIVYVRNDVIVTPVSHDNNFNQFLQS